MKNLNWEKFKKISPEKRDILVTFIFSFLLMCIYLIPKNDMISSSGDAASIWSAIKTFGNEYRESSYVMYKGFLSIYPYFWFYKLAEICSLNEFIFVKIYHIVLFAYITSVGFPNIISRLFNSKITLIRRLIFVILTFYMWEYTTALSQIMVDLPSLALFLLMVNSAMNISKNNSLNKYNFFITGLLIGMGFCFSGQYSLATLIILIYLGITIFEKRRYFNFKKIIVLAIVLLIGINIPISYNNYFGNTVLKEFRDRGDWLPEASVWAEYGVTRDLNKYDMATIKSNRGEAIIRKYGSYNNNEMIKINETIASGAIIYKFEEYIKIVMSSPFDFIVGCFNKLFLTLSFDGGKRSVSSLLLSYTAMFMFGLIFKKQNVIINDIFKKELLIQIAFLATVLPLCILHVENRYAIGINGFLLAVLVFNNIIYKRLECNKFKLSDFFKKNVNYTILIYLIFLIMCYIHYGVIYELIGSDPNQILFNW